MIHQARSFRPASLTLALLLASAFLLSSCITPNTQRFRDDTGARWTWNTGRVDSEWLRHDLFLDLHGRRHLIERNVPSLDDADSVGLLMGGDPALPPNAIGGVYFDGHVDGVTYYVIEGDGVMGVYRNAWGDENEGAVTTRLVKTIKLHPEHISIRGLLF